MRMEHLLEEIKELDIATSSVIASITSRLTQFVDMDPFDMKEKINGKNILARWKGDRHSTRWLRPR